MAVNHSNTLGSLIETNAARFPHEAAWQFENRRLTNLQWMQRGRQIVHALESVGIKRQDRAGVLAMNTLEYAEIFAAGWTSGIIISTVNFRLAPPEILWILKDSAPRVLFFEEQYLEVIAQLRPQLPWIEKYVCIGGAAEWAENYETFVASGQPQQATLRAAPEDVALLIYTSGTTGRPKGCILGQRELHQLGINLAMELRTEPQERALLMMPLFHIGATAIALAHMVRSGTVVVQRAFDPKATLDALEKQQIHLTHMAPTMVQMLLEQPDMAQRKFPNLHTLVYSAAPMPSTVLQAGLRNFGNVFVNIYGQTEVVSTAMTRSLHRPAGTEKEQGWLLSVGHPLIETELKVVDDNGQEVPVGQAGEVIVRSDAMCRGYWNNTAATLELIRDGWVYTGDIGKLDEGGMLYLVDRKKDVIISGGENIYSREVEEAIIQHPSVSEAAVIGVPDPKWGEAVCAVVTLKPGRTVSEATLIEHTRTLIASYKRPRHVRIVAELPKLPSGKINKLALRKEVPSAAPTKESQT